MIYLNITYIIIIYNLLLLTYTICPLLIVLDFNVKIDTLWLVVTKLNYEANYAN